LIAWDAVPPAFRIDVKEIPTDYSQGLKRGFVWAAIAILVICTFAAVLKFGCSNPPPKVEE